MNLYLSHTTALEIWRSGAIPELSFGVRSRRAKTVFPSKVVPYASKNEVQDIVSRFDASLPLHVLASSKNDCSSQKGALRPHVWSASSIEDAFVRLGDGLYLSSPEMCFLQMAQLLTDVELMMLGFELCGTYSSLENESQYKRSPLTTVERCRALVEGHRGRPGANKAMLALRYVQNGSNSPMETSLALLLGLPHLKGGASFGMPEMNHRIELSEEARNLYNRTYCLCDLYFPQYRLDVEYESYEFHTDSKKMEQDSLRRDALFLMGITVVTVTYRQVADLEKFEATINLLARLTGKRVRPRAKTYPEQQWALRKACL